MELVADAFDLERLVEAAGLFGVLLLTLLLLFVPIALLITLAQRRFGPARLQAWMGGASLPGAVARGLTLGALTPFCGCSTIPLLTGLTKARIRFAAVTAFFMASPLLNLFILATVAVLFSVQAAVVYAAFAAAASALVAVAWERLGLQRWLEPHAVDAPSAGRVVERAAVVSSRHGTEEALAGAAAGPLQGNARQGSSTSGREPSETSCCSGTAEEAGGEARASDRGVPRAGSVGTVGGVPAPSPWQGLRTEFAGALREAVGLLRHMLVPLLLGVAAGALIYGAVPEEMVTRVVDGVGPAAVPVAAALGIPLYLRGEAAFPIGAGLLAAGVPEGPMLAMVVGGMGASLPEVIMLRGLFTRRLLAAFLATIFVVAVAAGWLLPMAWNY